MSTDPRQGSVPGPELPDQPSTKAWSTIARKTITQAIPIAVIRKLARQKAMTNPPDVIDLVSDSDPEADDDQSQAEEQRPAPPTVPSPVNGDFTSPSCSPSSARLSELSNHVTKATTESSEAPVPEPESFKNANGASKSPESEPMDPADELSTWCAQLMSGQLPDSPKQHDHDDAGQQPISHKVPDPVPDPPVVPGPEPPAEPAVPADPPVSIPIKKELPPEVTSAHSTPEAMSVPVAAPVVTPAPVSSEPVAAATLPATEPVAMDVSPVKTENNACTESPSHQSLSPKSAFPQAEPRKKPITSETTPENNAGSCWSKCKYCGGRFTSRKLLDEHMNEHDDDRSDSCRMCQIRCQVCGQRFYRQSGLDAHMESHTVPKVERSVEMSGVLFESNGHPGIPVRRVPDEYEFKEIARKRHKRSPALGRDYRKDTHTPDSDIVTDNNSNSSISSSASTSERIRISHVPARDAFRCCHCMTEKATVGEMEFHVLKSHDLLLRT